MRILSLIVTAPMQLAAVIRLVRSRPPRPTAVDDAAGTLIHLLNADRRELLGRTVVAVPATPATQRDLFALTAAALGRPTPGRVPTVLAALAAGRVNAQVMTLDARCNPDLLTATGYTFRHETVQSGVTASLAVMTA